MVRSMTGFGSGRASDHAHSLVVELRSVNSKSCDVRTRLPRELSSSEWKVQTAVRGAVVRGRVDVVAELSANGDGLQEPRLNLPLARGYQKALERLRTELAIDAPITLEMILSAPGVVEQPDPSRGNEALSAMLELALAEAIKATNQMREQEGEALRVELQRLESETQALVQAIRAEVPTANLQRKTRLVARIAELTDSNGLDRVRLAQEVAFLVDRSDVTEELARLDSHLEQLTRVLRGEGPVGRRLDFLLQEMQREANTLGAKSSSAQISHLAVDLRSTLERLREQAQNVE